MKSRPLLTLALSCAVAFSTAPAAVKLPSIFSDHAVLQRQSKVPVWGWADAGEEITVSVAGQTKTTKADEKGKWRVSFENLKAEGPQELTVKGSSDVTVHDILIGEVWLGSGQSNMAMTVNRAKNYEEEKAAANTPDIRVFTVSSGPAATAQEDCKGKWVICSPDTVGGFSATAFFFGREVYRELKVPMGIINSSVGGTPIESWIDADTQRAAPELKSYMEEQAKAAAALTDEQLTAQYQKALAVWNKKVEEAKAAGKTLAGRAPKDPLSTRKSKGGPGELFNGKIAPLIPYAIRGALWYQGEANSNGPKSALYQFQLPLLVSDWRKRWGSEFPFAWVQLPNFTKPGDGDAWCVVREAELKSLKLPKTGMAVTLDVGEEHNIHPQDKQDVGKRLAMWALGTVYGKKDIATSGPLPAGHEIKGSEVTVKFTHTDGGLVAKDGPVKGFTLAGEDKQWHAAQARIEGNKVIVSSSEVSQPVALRYAWKDWPDCNLYNGVGIPATQFRTDDWPAPTPAPVARVNPKRAKKTAAPETTPAPAK